MVSDVTGKLEVRPAVLGEWGKEGVELFLGKTDDVGSGFFSELFEIELGGGAKCLEGRYGSKRGWGADDVGIGINRGGLKGVQVDEGDAGVGKRGRVSWGLWGIVIVEARTGEIKEGEAGDGELEGEFRT